MTVRPGRNLCLLIVSATLISIVSAWFTAAALLVIPLIAILLAGIAFELSLVPKVIRSATINLNVPATAGRGIFFDVSFDVHCQSQNPLDVAVRVSLPVSAEPRDWIARDRIQSFFSSSLQMHIPIRGQHQIGPAWIRLAGPWSLLDFTRELETSTHVDVLPEQTWTRERLSKDQKAEQQLLDKLSKAKRHGVGTEFESLHEFRSGDDPKRIDWRATARTRRLIVRRFQVEQHRDVMIVVDCGRLMGADATRGTKLDCAVDASLLLSRVALESGDRCGLGTFDDNVLGYLPPISGPKSMRSLVQCVYNLQTRWRESDFSRMFATLQTRQRKRALIVVLSDIIDAQTTRRFRSSLATLARRHVVVFAALKSPILTDRLQIPVTSLLDASRYAVAFRLLRERERAIHSLRHGGVYVVDADPAHISASLINQYIELRRQNVL